MIRFIFIILELNVLKDYFKFEELRFYILIYKCFLVF